MNVCRDTLIIGVLLSIGLGCAGPSNLSGTGTNPKTGLVAASSSEYKFLHIKWGNSGVGSLAHMNGIRYILNADHHKAGLPFLFSKKSVTIYGLRSDEAFQKWKAGRENAERQAIAAALLEREKAEQQMIEIAVNMLAQQKTILGLNAGHTGN